MSKTPGNVARMLFEREYAALVEREQAAVADFETRARARGERHWAVLEERRLTRERIQRDAEFLARFEERRRQKKEKASSETQPVDAPCSAPRSRPGTSG